MSQSKPEHPPEATPTIDAESATGGLDREWQREQRKRQRGYETKRVQPGPADSARVKTYKEQTDRAGRKVMELLRDHPEFRDVFRERIRFAAAPYEDYERQREEENRRQTKQRSIDLAAAARDPKCRDKNAKPPSKAYSWVQPEGCWMRRFAHADISPAPWLQALLDGERSSDPSELLPAYYGILSAIHDKHPDCRHTVTPPVWPQYLLNHVWRLLDPLHGLPATTIESAVKAVERDLTATIEAEPTTERSGPSTTGESMLEADAERIKRFASFFREIAQRTRDLLEMEPNRAFLRKKVEEFFRLVADSEVDDANSLDAREECERFIQEHQGDYAIRYRGGRWAVHKILVDGSEEECFKGPEIPRHVNPLDWFPPHAAWWNYEKVDATGNEALLRDCALITLIHDGLYAHHRPVAFFGADTPAWPGRFDILDGGFWPDRFRKKLLGFFWIPDADSPDVGKLKDFIEAALRCVRAAMPEGPEPKAGGNGSGQSGTAKGMSLSRPMPLTDLADRILKSPTKTRKLKSVYGNILHRLGDKSWQIELAGLPENIREQIERA